MYHGVLFERGVAGGKHLLIDVPVSLNNQFSVALWIVLYGDSVICFSRWYSVTLSTT